MSPRPPRKPRRLGDFIVAETPAILSAWEDRARAHLAAARNLSEPALRDHVPRLLKWVGEVTRHGQLGDERPFGELSFLHAQDRAQKGYDVADATRELALLRRVILEQWSAESGPLVNAREVTWLDEAVDMMLSWCVGSFGEAQRQDTQRRLDFQRELFGIVSHDLRNPLSAILMSCEGLLQRTLDDRSMRFVLRIRQSAWRAEKLVQDLLDFARARLGAGIPVQRRPIELHALVQGVLDEVRAFAADREIAYWTSGDGHADLDPDRIAQVAHNLVTNALKFSPVGSTVSVGTRGEGDTVVLEVRNAGPLIEADLLERIFEPFAQASHDGSAKNGGVGLGLYIVDSIVRAHGGSIAVRSNEQEGTVFTVSLPRSAPPVAT